MSTHKIRSAIIAALRGISFRKQKTRRVMSPIVAKITDSERFPGPRRYQLLLSFSEDTGKLEDFDIAINATYAHYNLELMRRALEARCHYLDLGWMFHPRAEQLKQNSEFKAAGLTTAVHGAAKLDLCDAVRIRVGSKRGADFSGFNMSPQNLSPSSPAIPTCTKAVNGGSWSPCPGERGSDCPIRWERLRDSTASIRRFSSRPGPLKG